MEKLSITVPFIYRAEVVMPRRRKSQEVPVLDQVTVTIESLDSSELKPSFIVGQTEFLWYKNSNWIVYHETVIGQKPREVTIEELIDNTSHRTDYPYSCAGAAAPFHNVWQDVITENEALIANCNNWLKDVHQKKEDIDFRTWKFDNKSAVVELIHEIADDLVFVDGILHRKVGEPRYEVSISSKGNGLGSTNISVTTEYNVNLSANAYFSANEFEEALKIAQKAADLRKDPDENRNFNPERIQVLIPEAVMLTPEAFFNR
ncbi:hypothetical protein DZF79_28625 [Vibrio parahaemolyticus]|nr:hypothetical protein [Vibrio parahaemolyticus]